MFSFDHVVALNDYSASNLEFSRVFLCSHT